MTLAAIYARISQDRGQVAAGVTRQQADCRKLIEQRGWTEAGCYVDNDVSAFSGVARPAYIELCQAVEAGHIGAIVAWHPDRLHRSPRELEDFIDLVETAGVAVATATAGDVDLATPDGRAFARMMGLVARKESEDKSRRTRRALEQRAADGLPKGGGRRPYGWTREGTDLVSEEADIVREAARRVLMGEALNSVRRDLNSRGVPTVTGAPWAANTLAGILRRPRNAGLATHHGEIVGEGTWAPILDRAEWEQLIAAMRQPHPKPKARSYLWSGIIECGNCDRPVPGSALDRKRAYQCRPPRGCGRRSVLADLAEGVLAPMLFAAVEQLPSIAAPDTSAIVDELADLEARESELAEIWAEGDLTRREWATARDRLAPLLDRARSKIRASTRSPLDGIDCLEAAWPDLAFAQQRAIIEAVVDRVILHRPNRRVPFDPDRLEVVWRA